MLKVYDKFTDDFSGNGLAVLQDAYDVRVRKVINGEWELTFNLPKSEKWQYVLADNIVMLEGQRYRIVNMDGEMVTAVPIYRDAVGKHIQFIDDIIGDTPENIMQQLFEDTDVHIMTADEIESLGMEWVDNETDFFAQSRITPIGGLITLMETLEKYKVHSELYFDNYNIALVKQIGKDRGYRIDLHRNSDSIKPKIDASGIVTRLYPYGKDGLEISSVNNGVAYIDSPNIGNFVRHEGFLNFDDITEPEDLLDAAQAQFSEDNPDRIDVPKYSIDVNCFLKDGSEVQLGDTVTVNDELYGVVSKQRVVEVDCYPFEIHRTTIVVGKPSVSLADIIDKAEYYYTKSELESNERGELKTECLEMMDKNTTVTISDAQFKDKKIALYKTGSLYESEDAAIAIVDGVLAVANSKTSDGDWIWTLVMNSDEITIKDRGGTPRFVCGNNSSEKYLFELYNEDGAVTVGIDSDGNAVFSGKVESSAVYSSSFIGTNSLDYAEIDGGVFAKIDPTGIKMMQDEKGVRKQKFGVSVADDGTAYLVMGAGNGNGSTNINGVVYTNGAFKIEKNESYANLSLSGYKPAVTFWEDTEELWLSGERILVNGVDLEEKISKLENAIKALQ